MRVHMCGVRGSMPAPGVDFAGVGGQTSCVALAHDGEEPSLVLDAGTGLRTLTELLERRPFRGVIVLSHLHWDHIMGLPFFSSGDHPDAEVTLLVPRQAESAEALLSRAMSPPLFPITPGQLRGRWTFDSYDEGEFDVAGFSVVAREIPHKGGRTMGLRVADSTATVAYLPDHAPHLLGLGPRGTGAVHEAADALVTSVDLLLHDAQYTPDEMEARFDWGHAVADYAVHLAEHCDVGRVMLFHHDPSRTDVEVGAIHRRVSAGASVPVEVAVEGATIDI